MATFLRRFHLFMVILWAGLAIPGVTLWKESILFLIIISLSTQIKTSFGAYMAARAEREAEANGKEEG